MTEHRIRFRGAWDWHGLEAEAEVARRVTLPIDWDAGLEGRFLLLRRFGRPPLDPSTQSARLDLRSVPGLRSARLNGRDLGPIPSGVVGWSIPLDHVLLPRNSLVLEVVLPPEFEARQGWGAIALVVEGRV